MELYRQRLGTGQFSLFAWQYKSENGHTMRLDRLPMAATLICLFFCVTNASAQRPTETSLKDALSVAEKAQGTDSPQVASALANLGAFYVSAGSVSSAGPLLQRAERIVA